MGVLDCKQRPGEQKRSNDELVGTKLYGRPSEKVREERAHPGETSVKCQRGTLEAMPDEAQAAAKGNFYVLNATGEKQSPRKNNSD